MMEYSFGPFVQPLCLLNAPAGSFSRDIDELNRFCVSVTRATRMRALEKNNADRYSEVV